MAQQDAHNSRGFWRLLSMVVSAGLGLAAVCLVVFSTSQKQTQIGVLLGLWGGLIAAFGVFGARRTQHGGDVADLRALQQQTAELQATSLEATRRAQATQELELRRFGELQVARETAARREADFRLEIGLRQEIERVLTEQIGALRDEIASLRSEVVEKLDSQLRMERIETTRLIGSDLEALQHEIRRLANTRESLAASAGPSRPVGRADHPEIVDAEVVEIEHLKAEPVTPLMRPPPPPPPTPPPAPTPPPPPPTASPPYQAPVYEPPPYEPPPYEPRPYQPSRYEPAAASFDSSRDPFAGLPRLSPVSSDVADLLLPTNSPSSTNSHPSTGPDHVGADERYVGRRRAATEEFSETGGSADETSSVQSSGRRRAPDF